MIGSGVGSLVGGEISEELGGSYELGAFVGNLVGGVAGSMLYRYADKIPRTVKGCVDLDATIGRGGSSSCSTLNGGQGYDSFEQAKNALGSAGEGKAWHHIVEQSQIQKSGFSATDIHNTKNLVAIDSGYSGSIHSQISGYYNSKPRYTNGNTIRNWLAGQSFDDQFEFGMKQLQKFGTMTPTNKGWIFKPFA